MTAPIMLPRLMRSPAAARYISVSESKLRSLPIRPRRHGGMVLYDRHDLDLWVDGLPHDGDTESVQFAADREADEAFCAR